MKFYILLLLVFLASCQPDNPGNSLEVDPEPLLINRDSTYYKEHNRPGYHFSPPYGLMKEPNGMLYHDGEYHLFYQFNPKENSGGAWNWGHAVSKNLSNWEHLPVALKPDKEGNIGSGSAVMDYLNSSGFGSEKKPAMVAAFTYHKTLGDKVVQSPGIAYSTDKGRSWTKYSGNPVIPNPGLDNFRDPKLLWHGPTQKWIMVISAGDRVKFYHSGDLKKWTFASDFGEDQGSHEGLGLWQKPDLFYLPYKGKEEGGKWLLVVSINKGRENGGTATQYFIGDFDGSSFSNSYAKETKLWMDYGVDYTGMVSCSGMPPGDLRKIAIGWLSNEMYAEKLPTKAWRNVLTMPRSFVLKKHDAGLTLNIQPIREVKKVKGETHNYRSLTIDGEKDITSEISFSPHSCVILLDLWDEDRIKPNVGLELSNAKGEKLRLGYDFKTTTYYIDRSKSGQVDFSTEFNGLNSFKTGLVDKDRVNIFVFVDGSVIELYMEESSSTMCNLIFPTEPYTSLKLFTEGGKVKMQGRVLEMKSSWQ